MTDKWSVSWGLCTGCSNIVMPLADPSLKRWIVSARCFTDQFFELGELTIPYQSIRSSQCRIPSPFVFKADAVLEAVKKVFTAIHQRGRIFVGGVDQMVHIGDPSHPLLNVPQSFYEAIQVESFHSAHQS
ncbi:MAG: hypothetical protein J3Q66DRAFT_375984 [Benniella sp.]|nr:MAG: hypothetical protein J3Q66DRAFT_375984 [Benniella sp.]